MAVQARQDKRLQREGVGPSLPALAVHEGQRLHEGGVGPQMRSAVGLKKETPPEGGVGPEMLSPAGFMGRIMGATGSTVKPCATPGGCPCCA